MNDLDKLAAQRDVLIKEITLLQDELQNIQNVKNAVLNDLYRDYKKFATTRPFYFTCFDGLNTFKSMVYAMRNNFKENGAWSLGVQDEFMDMAYWLCKNTENRHAWFFKDIERSTINKEFFVNNSTLLLAAVIQSMYRCELIDYLDDKKRFEDEKKNLDNIYIGKFEDWKNIWIQEQKEAITNELHEKAHIVRDWVAEFKVGIESGVVLMFGRFYDMLDFSSIRNANTRCPDCVAIKDGKEIRIEFEYKASNFLAHKHDPSKVDLVVCWINDRELSIPVISLKDELEKLGVIAKSKP